MKIVVFLLTAFVSIENTVAALPPQYQNAKDIDVMVEYIKTHPIILSTLKSIDFLEYTVNFGNNCKAVFGRKSVAKAPGWVGPAAPLEFKSSNCSVD